MVFVMLANGFEEVEAITTIDFLRRCGIDVRTVAVTNTQSLEVVGGHQIPVLADVHIKDATNVTMLQTGAAIVLPGGAKGVENLLADEQLKGLVDKYIKANTLVAAICAAPTILAKWGHLDGKKATCYPSLTNILTENGAQLEPGAVVVDGQIITSRGAGTTHLFSRQIAENLGYGNAADKVFADMLYKE